MEAQELKVHSQASPANRKPTDKKLTRKSGRRGLREFAAAGT
jgi:hypothetical protein